MIRRRGPPSQTWRTFLRSHAEAIAAIDLCLVPTLTFERLFTFLVLCLDHVPIFGERHLRRILPLYSSYYNQTRTHLALGKDAPLRRAVQGSGAIIATPILFGLHHHYARM